MPRAVIYCRVSTKEQVQTLSLPTQRRACGDYCERQGWEVDRIFVEEGASAKTADRTELNNLILHCCRNKGRIDYVVVYNLSRFARDTKVHHALAGALASSGIALRSATEPIDGSPAGRFMESIFSSIAQFDNDVKAERTREGMCAALRLGRWTFQAPVGYLNGVRGGPSLVPDPARAELVRLAFEDYASGRFQKSDLLKRLDARGLKTRRGQALSPQTLHAILCNRLYAGRIDVPKWGISVRGDFEPLVPEEVFLRVQARLPGRGKPPALHRRDHPDFPLRRFVACAACGKPLTGSNSRGKSARPYPYYHCVACGKVRVRKSRLEDEFRGLLARLRPREEYARLFNEIVLDVWRDRQKETRQSRARLEVQLAGHKQRLGDLDEAFIYRRVIDQATYEGQRDRLREQVWLAEAELEEARDEELDVEGVLAFAQHVLTHAAQLWEQASLDRKQRLQRVFFPQGLTFDGSGFGNVVTCLAFSELLASGGAADGLASPTGFEPVSPP